MAFCTQCGNRIEAGAKFCANCGHAVDSARTRSSALQLTHDASDAQVTPPPRVTALSSPDSGQSLWRRFRGQRAWVQVVAWVFISPIILLLWVWSGTRWSSFGKVAATAAILLISITAAASGSGGSTAKSSAPSASAPATTTAPAPPPTTTAPAPVDVADMTAAVLAHVKQTFPKATVTCDGSSGQAVCYVTLNDYLDTSPQTGTGINASDVLSELSLPTRAAERKAQAQAKAEAKAKRLAHRRAVARAAALRKIGTPVARRQAIESAQSYLDEGTGFSRAGLINQLDSKYGEGFTVALATFAVDHVHVNWNQQAVDSAKGYLRMGGFSRDGLIQQLTSSYGEGFTYAQAVYAVNKVGL
jgi:hypothetical protein